MVHSVKEIINTKANKRIPKNIAYEFQDFGVRLAQSLGDLKHKSFYIKLSKEVDRSVLEKARDLASDYPKAKSKARVFMWYLHELRARGSSKLQASTDSQKMILESPRSPE
ncbi:MAG: hypothetical protein M1352_00060 [Patescibacteria group bacterium]|nr:hypothetical protein [Patescibacteria group bacterium]